ncbi:MAG: MBL fold metallo-hydrolase [Deltaproteobacteria bacterium]|nr:MBL fold metallo-hydrolase [Deltaproteobacteria bacterium]
MWIKANAQLTENIYQVTTPASCHFLICGEKIALVDCGIGATANTLIADLEVLFAEDVALDYLFLTHTHFDHVGALPQLKKRWPALQVVASRSGAEKLKDKNILEYISKRNQECAAAFGENIDVCASADIFHVHHFVGDGDDIDLGAGVVVKAISCPGHSKEQFAYFVPSDRALSGAEAFGVYFGRDKLLPAFNNNYHDYINSLERAAKIEVRMLGFSHSGALTGDLAQKYLLAARVEAERFFQMIKDRISGGQLVEEIVLSILPEWQAEILSPEGPFVRDQEETLREMVKAVAAA